MVNKQIQNVFEDEELQEDSVISKMEITAADGKCYQTKHYNLEMLIALGYRIRSKVATKFRQTVVFSKRRSTISKFLTT